MALRCFKYFYRHLSRDYDVINVKVFEAKIFENKDFLDLIYSMKELS